MMAILRPLKVASAGFSIVKSVVLFENDKYLGGDNLRLLISFFPYIFIHFSIHQ